MKVHIQRKHNGLGMPLLLDAQTFHETEGNAISSSDSMERPMNYSRDINSQAPFATSDPLETVYSNLMKIKKRKQTLDKVQSLAREIFNSTTCSSDSSAYPAYTTPSTSSPLLPSRVQSSLEWNLDVNAKTPLSYDSNLDPLRDMIIGFKGYACDTCVSCGITPVYNIVELDKAFSNKHVCDPIKNLPPSSENIFRQYVRKALPYVITNEYIKWSGGSLFLTSKKFEVAPKNLIRKSFCIPNINAENHWLLRVIFLPPTALVKNDLLEFIYLSESNNINLFEIHSSGKQELVGDYGLLLVKK